MPYLGNPVVDRFTSTKAASVYSGDGSTVAFTLEHSVGSDEDILVSVDGVIQEPSVAYAVSSGTTLTFTAAPSNNAGNNIFVYYLFRTIGTVTHPPTSALSATSGTFSGNTTVAGTSTFTGDVTVGDGSAADKKILFDGNAVDYHIGLDDSADSLIIGKGSALGTTTSMAINADGIITKPLQPAFLAVPSSGSGGTTNMSTNTTIVFGTEKFDQNGDFASNTFTAPVTGKYQLNFMARVDNIDTAANWQRLVLVTSNTTYESQIIDLGGLSGDPAYWMFNINVLADMDANDTAFIKYQQDDGAAQTDVTEQAFFSGYLAC
jgi:hypothetical protein